MCHYLNHGRTLNGILIRVAQWMACFDLCKLYLALSEYTESVRILTAMVTDVIKLH